MLVVGYDNAKQALKMMSSHGAAFGENGCVWIPYSTIENTSYFRYACYLEKGYDSYLAAQEQRNDNPFYTLSGKVSKILHPPSLSLSSDEYWLKEGYYKAFENIKIVLAGFNPDSESAIIQIRDDNYNYLKSFNIERIGSSHTFHIGEETYRFSFTNIINANILPFKKAIAFTVEKL